MDERNGQVCNIEDLITGFFKQDDLRQLVASTGEMLESPILVLDDAFRVVADFSPFGFSDLLFNNAVSCGEITYEASAIISKSIALCDGNPEFIKLEESPYRRRFAPLICTGVRLGYFICVDIDGHLQRIPAEIWQKIEMILSKQLFIEISRQDKPFETTEEILMHLLDGGFSSASYFRLQTASTYLADFHPSAFALIDLTVYHNEYLGKRHLKKELATRFPESHAFLYRGDIFLFLLEKLDVDVFSELAEEFGLKVVISEAIGDLFDLPVLYRAANDALKMVVESGGRGSSVCSVAQLRTPLLLKNLESREDLIAPTLRKLAEHDRKKNTQYCETLYYYLVCSRSLKKTCDALFTHRNTVLYRIRRMQEDFQIPLDDPAEHIALLLGASILLFRRKGADFFLQTLQHTEHTEEDKP